MHFNVNIELPHADGTAFVDPEDVVVLKPDPLGCLVILASGVAFSVRGTPLEISEKLWRFKNEVEDGSYFNANHVQAVVPHQGGSRLIMTGQSFLDIPAPVGMIMDLLRTSNAVRNRIVGEL